MFRCPRSQLLGIASLAACCVFLLHYRQSPAGLAVLWSSRPSSSAPNDHWLLSLPETAIIVDPAFLKTLEAGTPTTLSSHNAVVKIAVDKRAKVDSRDYPQFDIILYDNDVSKDFIVFEDDVPRAMPRSVIDMKGPNKVKLFLQMWERSRLVECLGLKVERNFTGKSKLLPTHVDGMARWRDELMIEYDMIPHLCEGTLLGWFRECAFIPHTHDVDFCALIEFFSEEKYEKMRRNMTSASMFLRIGMPEDSLEFKFRLTGQNTPTDLFFLYMNETLSWLAGTGSKGDKYRYYFPRIERYCSAILHNHLFTIPCDVEELIKTSYGESWRLDHPTSRFGWSSSHKNVKHVGRYTKKEMKDAYRKL